jgi:hypothetical protein
MRHGTRKSYEDGCRCDGCRLMHGLYSKKKPVPVKLWERHPLLDPEPYRVIVRALGVMGYTQHQLAVHAGVHYQTIAGLWHGKRDGIEERTAKKLRSLVELLPSEAVA